MLHPAPSFLSLVPAALFGNGSSTGCGRRRLFGICIFVVFGNDRLPLACSAFPEYALSRSALSLRSAYRRLTRWVRERLKYAP
jgi:hypothetical protein